MSNLENKTQEEFSNLARTLREEAGIKRTTLGKQMGYGRSYGSYIRRVEEGRVNPSADMVLSYVKFFKIPSERVFNALSNQFLKSYRQRLDREGVE